MNDARHLEIELSEADLRRELSRRTRRGFLVGGIAAAIGIGGYEWLRTRPQELGVPWPQRRVLSLNRDLAHAYLNDSHTAPSYSLREVSELKPNGDIGMDDETSNENWTVDVQTSGGGSSRKVSVAEILSLPKVEMTTRFCCIEGWSTIANWGGVRFSDFTRKVFPESGSLPDYVYLATPNEEYYVGLDMKSALHPQTLLAYEQNGKPLTPDHGAPLRLVIPVKYGIKNIKRIGSIRYSGKQPNDYWHELGYDWFAGL